MTMTHDSAPRPPAKPVPLAKVDTFDEVINYALGGFHASLDKAEEAKGDTRGQWERAAGAYLGAYTAAIALKPRPSFVRYRPSAPKHSVHSLPRSRSVRR